MPGDGTTRNAIYRSTEESRHLAHAVIAALKEAGFEIRKADEDAQR
jgi:hypothetical protein